MINISNLKVKYGEQTVLNIDQLKISKLGLYIILGPSGCGKTTLLNVLANLETNYQGDVIVKHRSLKKINKQQTTNYLKSFVSVCFQHNVLLEELTVFENIALIYQKYHKRHKQSRELSVVVKSLGLEHLLDKSVKKLSGGEKNRVAIARAILKDARLYLFDEPTSALDKENAEGVMHIIKEKAQDSIVILVTHDQELANKYGDVIINMSFGKIISLSRLNVHKVNLNINNHNNLAHSKFNNALPIARGLYKAHRRQNTFATTCIVLGLISLSVSSLLTSSVNMKLTNAFRGKYNEDTMFVENKQEPRISVIKSANKEAVQTLSNKTDTPFAALYQNDFSTLFTTRDRLILTYQNRQFTLPSFHANLFNEVSYLQELDEELNPYINYLALDEVALQLPLDDFRLLLFAFGLPYRNSAYELGLFLASQHIYLSLQVSNNNWDYDDEQLFLLKAVKLGPTAKVIVSELSFTEQLFEDKMTLPSSLNLTKVEEYPWTLKKIYYFFTKKRDYLLFEGLKYSDLLLVTGSRDLFNSSEDPTFLNNRIFVFETPRFFNQVLTIQQALLQDDMLDYFYTFTNGLMFFSDLMITGFMNNFFVASDPVMLANVLEADVTNKQSRSVSFTLPQNIVNFAAQYNVLGGFNYNRALLPLKLNEIVITTKLAIQLFGRNDVIAHKLHIGALLEINEINQEYIKTYATTELIIKDVIKSNDIGIYHHELWPYLLYKDVFHVSPFSLALTGVVINTPIQNKEIINIKDFNISYPYLDFYQSINSSLKDIQFFSNVLALGMFILALLIVFMMIYLLTNKTHDQLVALQLIGYAVGEVFEIIGYYIFILISKSLVYALGQTLIISILLEVILSKYFKTNFSYMFISKPYSLMLFSAFMMFIVNIAFFYLKYMRISVIKYTKKDL